MYLQEKVYELVPYSFLFRTAKQHRSASRLAFSANRPSRQVAAGQSGGLQGTACLRPPVLDESLIREQTKVDHFWGELSGGYCPDCSGRREVVASGAHKVRVLLRLTKPCRKLHRIRPVCWSASRWRAAGHVRHLWALAVREQ